ncbi:MAG: GreA/GreB family elongation factor, partial [Candidatus Nealsonbacteria bacterium]|nr:GreA/GreB family elongation factor [Candidatus Nealsonbacteria bacterium]
MNGRSTVVSLVTASIQETEQKLTELARDKASADGPRTSWHSQTHLDIERAINDYQRFLQRCRRVLSSLEKYQPSESIVDGSLVSLQIEGVKREYAVVEREDGGDIGDYGVLSSVSPIGRAVWRKKSGEEVEAKVPDGTIAVKILEVAYQKNRSAASSIGFLLNLYSFFKNSNPLR